ncbi:hypothetical protein M798_03040 [Brucella melitensis ADMAS-G1]|nr:hypothetical protein M798_03040 [Brucella melitensis ADMAS-G1]
MLGDDGLQNACPHFHRLLHHVIEPPLFQRRKAIDKLARLRLRACLLQGFEEKPLSALRLKARFPLAVAPVKDQNLVAFLHAKHMSQIMGSLRPGIEGDPGPKLVFNVKSLHSVIRAHGASMAEHRGYGQVFGG